MLTIYTIYLKETRMLFEYGDPKLDKDKFGKKLERFIAPKVQMYEEMLFMMLSM